MEKRNDLSEQEALNAILSALRPLEDPVKRRIINATLVFFGFGDETRIRSEKNGDDVSTRSEPNIVPLKLPYSQDTSLSPKEFVKQKSPQSDVERVACLAYFLTHYRETPYFKTLDISKLNTEAAQPKLANAAKATANALQYGYLAAGPKGQRQLSAAGEDFIMALPDREAAKLAMERARSRKKNKSPTRKKIAS